MNSALWCSISHPSLVIPELLMGDTCLGVVGIFNILKCRIQGGSPLHRMIMYIQGKKRQNCCLENRNVSLVRKHLANATLRKRTFEEIDSEKLCLSTGNYFPKDTSVWLWGNEGTKREQGIFHLIWDTHAPHLGKRRISEKLTANWNFYNLNHAFSNTFLEKMGPQNILSSRV